MKKLKEKRTKLKEKWNALVNDIGDFSWNHPFIAGNIFVYVMLYWMLVILGLTVHRHDELKWIRK